MLVGIRFEFIHGTDHVGQGAAPSLQAKGPGTIDSTFHHNSGIELGPQGSNAQDIAITHILTTAKRLSEIDVEHDTAAVRIYTVDADATSVCLWCIAASDAHYVSDRWSRRAIRRWPDA